MEKAPNQNDFENLLQEFQNSRQKISTKEELIVSSKNQGVIDKATQYTFDNIVKSLSGLQLSFSASLENLSGSLLEEVNKFIEINNAISIETKRLKQLQEIKMVADASYLLKRQQESRLMGLNENFENLLGHIELEKIKLKADWEIEQKEFDKKNLEENILIEKERVNENERYNYDWERKQKLEKDKFDEEKKILDRSLYDLFITYEKRWKERNETLDSKEKLHLLNIQSLNDFDSELATSIKIETEKAISRVSLEINAKQGLISKEEESNELISNLEIKDLEEIIKRNEDEIVMLNEKYNQAIKQMQELSAKALDLKQI